MDWKKIWNWIWNNRTKITGYTTTILGVLAVSDVPGAKWFLLISSLATAVIGHANSYKMKQETGQKTEGPVD